MLKRGFISRSAGVVTLVGALALLSSISGVTAGTTDGQIKDAQLLPASPVFSSAATDGFSYSRWLQNQDVVPASTDSNDQQDAGQTPITYGSFVLTETPLERVYGNVKDSWTQTFRNIITRAADTQILRGWAMDYVTGQDVDIDAGIDSWWEQRRSDTTGIFVGMADVLTDNVFQAGEDQVGGLSFIRSLDWSYQTSLGDRPWAVRLDAVGSLREAADDVVIWQFGGGTGEDRQAIANAGLAYRWAQEDTAMLGVNSFLDYASTDHGDYYRWSVGGEVRTEWLDLHGNRYIVLSDSNRLSDGRTEYSQDGLDIEMVLHAPNARWISGKVRYELWEGQHGDGDEESFIYGVNISPPMVENLRIDLEIDNDGWDVGGRVSYRHEFGGIPTGSRTASSSSSSSFDPRDYFFDRVRRDYSQRIKISGVGGDKAVASVQGARAVFTSGSATLTVLFEQPGVFNRSESIAVAVEQTIAGALASVEYTRNIIGLSGSGYDMSVSHDANLSFEGGGYTVNLANGDIYLDSNGDPKEVHMGDAQIALLDGANAQMDISYVGTDRGLTLHDGQITVVNNGGDLVATVMYMGELHYDGGTVFACNDATAVYDDGSGVEYYGTGTREACALRAADGSLTDAVVPVELTAEVGRITPAGGFGDYTFDLGGNYAQYFTIDNNGVVSVVNAPLSLDGTGGVLMWTLVDDNGGSANGEVAVTFTKSPSAEPSIEVRYAVVGEGYNDALTIDVVGGVPDTTNGYTFALAAGTPSGYALGSNNGDEIVLNASGVTYSSAGEYYVTVSIDDSQTPPQSGEFVLEVRVVENLAFTAPSSATEIFQGASFDFSGGVAGGNTVYSDAGNVRTYNVVSADTTNFTVDNNGVLAVGEEAAVALAVVDIEVVDTVPPQQATANVQVDVQYTEFPVRFDRARSNLPESIDPDVDLPVSIILTATGGAQNRAYTFSIIENDATWLTIVAPNILVVNVGAPGTGSYTFKVEVEDTNSSSSDGTEKDQADITFAFMRPLATVDNIQGVANISGSGVSNGYQFDPKAQGGTTLDVVADGNTAQVVLENGQVTVNAVYIPVGSLNPATGEWIFFSAREIAELISLNASPTFKGEGIAFTDATGEELAEAYNTPGMLAIIIGSGDNYPNIVSGVKYVGCHLAKFGTSPGAYSCSIQDPSTTTSSSARSAASISPAASAPSTGIGDWPWGINTFYAHFPVLLPRYQTPDVDCETTDDLTQCANKLAIIAGGQSTFLPIELTERDDVQFFPYGGTWIFFGDGGPTDRVGELSAGFTLEYSDSCMVTLPDTAVCSDSSSTASSSIVGS